MATIPLSGTNIRLLSGVPFQNDYKHTRWFDTQSQQENYFMSKPTVFNLAHYNFQVIDTGIGVMKVGASYDQLWNTNYLMFQNAQYNTKWFYAFVTKIKYVQTNMTEVHFEIDVFQTWKFSLTVKPSFVSREHRPLWLSSGNPVINTVDEGLDYGKDYDVTKIDSYSVASDIMYLVIVAKSTLHASNDTPVGYINTSINGAPQPLCIYIHPFDSFGGSPEVLYDGNSYALPNVIDVMNAMYQQENSVNNIVSIYFTNHVGLDTTFGSGVLNIQWMAYQNLEFVDVGNGNTTIYVSRSLSYVPTSITCKGKYDGLMNGVTESKLLMYPYSFHELTDLKGNTTILKGENFSTSEIVMNVLGSMGYSNKVAYVPQNYLTTGTESVREKSLVTMGLGLIDNAPNDVAVITDMLAAFMQGNRNSLMNQAESIAFNGALNVASGAASSIGSVFRGNVGGAVRGGLDMVRGGGNALLQMEGISAKTQDIDNTPPQVSKMGSNSFFDYGNGIFGFYLVAKQVRPEYKTKLQQFWNMFGYKINEVKVPNFHTRQNWNYVQTVSCNVLGNINNNDMQEFKNILDNGITLWHTDDIGNYSLSNEVIA